MRLERENSRYTVYVDDQCIGWAELYDNPYHMRNCYVKLELELERLDPEISGELFEKLRKLAGRPLQVMVSSERTELTAFLLAGGFVCRRKCYEVEACEEDYVGNRATTTLLHAHVGEPDYDLCCQLMFDSYVETHKAINPWTADYEAFCHCLPADVIYEKAAGQIINLAFTENNEIAYVCSSHKQSFSAFISSLIPWLFQKYKRVCLESDDCDWAAMELKAMFINQDGTSYDTYLYGESKLILEKVRMDRLTSTQFAQIVDIEKNCGLEPYTPNMLLNSIENMDTIACFDGGNVVGFITTNHHSCYLRGSLYIVNLNVAKAYRGQGIAKKLLYQVYEYYIQKYADRLVFLDVAKSNQAIELYKKIGFQIMDMPSRNGDTDVVMAMPLSVLGENIRKAAP